MYGASQIPYKDLVLEGSYGHMNTESTRPHISTQTIGSQHRLFRHAHFSQTWPFSSPSQQGVHCHHFHGWVSAADVFSPHGRWVSAWSYQGSCHKASQNHQHRMQKRGNVVRQTITPIVRSFVTTSTCVVKTHGYLKTDGTPANSHLR